MSATKHDRVDVRAQLLLAEVSVASSDLDAQGVLHLQVGYEDQATKRGVQLLLEQGLELKGIAVLDGDIELTGETLSGMLVVLIGEGAGALLLSNDAGVTSSRRLMLTSSVTQVGIDARQIIIRYSVADSRWVVPDWDSFASNPASWSDPAPTSGADATARLAALASEPRTFVVGPCSLNSGGNAHAKYYGPTATIEEIAGVVNSSIAMISSSTLAVSLGATPISMPNGGVVFDQNYSAGDEEIAVPTADNVILDGDSVHVEQSGLNLLAGTATLFLKLRAKP